MKLNLKDLVLDEKDKEEFLEKVEQFMDIFSLRDEMSIYRSTPRNTILCKTLSNERRTEESHTKRNGQTQAFRYYL